MPTAWAARQAPGESSKRVQSPASAPSRARERVKASGLRFSRPSSWTKMICRKYPFSLWRARAARHSSGTQAVRRAMGSPAAAHRARNASAPGFMGTWRA